MTPENAIRHYGEYELSYRIIRDKETDTYQGFNSYDWNTQDAAWVVVVWFDGEPDMYALASKPDGSASTLGLSEIERLYVEEWGIERDIPIMLFRKESMN